MTRGPKIFICTDKEPPAPDTSDCPDNARHTPAPRGYVSWHAWADEMSTAYRQTRCPGCGLFKIWIPKAGAR